MSFAPVSSGFIPSLLSPDLPPDVSRPAGLNDWSSNTFGVTCAFGAARLQVCLLGANLVRIRFAVDGAFAPRRSWAVARADETFPGMAFQVRETPDGLRIEAEHVRVHVTSEQARVDIFDPDGQPILEDGADGGPLVAGSSAGGAWVKRMPPDERYLGFGERTGQLDKRGRRYTAWTTDVVGDHGPGTDSMYQAIPFFLGLKPSGRAYGVFLNNTFRSAFDLTRTHADQLRMEVAGGELDYYVLLGPQPADVVEQLTDLVGRMPLPPRWSLGYHQSRYSYYPAAVVRAVAHEFRRRRLPADVIHLDIDYMDAYRLFTWDPERFPDPHGLAAELAESGFKLVTIVDVGVKHQPEGGYGVYDEGHARGYFVRERATDQEWTGFVWPGRSVFPDFVRADVRRWWGDLHRGFVADGVRGIWNDMNEPAVHVRPFGDPDLEMTWPPEDSPQGDPGEPTTHGETHNVYGYLEDQATYEGLRRLQPDRRPFVLTRAGYAGIQRWSAVWTGDNAGFWEHLEMSLPQLMNLGLSGVAMAGVDIGGFWGNSSGELFARWMQLGAFYPFARGHSVEGAADKEPWTWGEDVERICRASLELRYRLLPYLYTRAWEASQRGWPILRPLLFHYPRDRDTHALADHVLVGQDLLVAPILRAGARSRSVYLPSGRWYDFWTGDGFDGPRSVLAEADLTTIPVYARGGSIVPFGPVLQHADAGPLDPLTLEVYPDADGRASGVLYEDDGESFDYEQGSWSLTRFSFAAGELTTTREGAFEPPERTVAVNIHAW